MGQVRFLVDGMLGTLAKWLRILGYDTIYDARLDDDSLVRIAMSESRLLLTRDRRLAARRGPVCLIIEGTPLREQLTQVLQFVGGSPPARFTRCPQCNSPLQEVTKEAARGKVPSFTYQTQNEFRLCLKCHKFYWAGTHRAAMEKWLSDL